MGGGGGGSDMNKGDGRREFFVAPFRGTKSDTMLNWQRMRCNIVSFILSRISSLH